MIVSIVKIAKLMTQFITLNQVAQLIHSDRTLALGGLSLYRRPVALTRALLQRAERPQNLTLLTFTAGYAADLLVGAGVVSRVRTCYFGLEAFGLAPMFTHRANSETFTIMEETETSLVLGLRATVSGVSYLPSSAWQGTDLLTLRPDVMTVADPYTGEMLTAFPAIPVDVAVIHALEGDKAGNVAINNNLAIDQLLVYAADTVIVTVEQIVDEIQPALHKTIIPSPGIDYIALAPNGAYPTSCYPLYPISGRELMQYMEQCASPEGFERYLAAWLA